MYSILNGIVFVIGHIIAYYIVLITHKLTEKLAIDVMTTLYFNLNFSYASNLISNGYQLNNIPKMKAL